MARENITEACDIFTALMETQAIKHEVGRSPVFLEKRAECWKRVDAYLKAHGVVPDPSTQYILYTIKLEGHDNLQITPQFSPPLAEAGTVMDSMPHLLQKVAVDLVRGVTAQFTADDTAYSI